jgi:acetylornithine deacetylase/succinyl-diaminopimelate desuccinylase-like protein
MLEHYLPYNDTNSTGGKAMNNEQIQALVSSYWDDQVMPALCQYLTIPNLSPDFDQDWQQNGHMQDAIKGFKRWVDAQQLRGASVKLLQLQGKTPLLFVDVAGERSGNVLFYGHCDKQPEASGWDHDKGPWQPVIENDRLYGRGAADDGYAFFSAISAIKTCQLLGKKHPRCMVLIECCEESGSKDLPAYLDLLQDDLSDTNFVICLDSGAGNYQQLWSTKALRGLVQGELAVKVLDEPVHSGLAGGVVPTSFRILRALLSRIENEHTGEILLRSVQQKIPENLSEEAKRIAEVIGNDFVASFPWHQNTQPQCGRTDELIMSNTWRASLTITAIDGMPQLIASANVIGTQTTIMLSLRCPPGVDPLIVANEMKTVLEANPPYQASVSFAVHALGQGWQAPPLTNDLEQLIANAACSTFGDAGQSLWCGGSIPLMNLLQENFPEAKFWVTGVLGPESNAHGPNEFLHLPYVRQLTACVAKVLMGYGNDL